MSKREEQMEFISRYDVLGPPNGCKGQCEGTGFIPHFERSANTPPRQALRIQSAADDNPPIYRVLWHFLEAKQVAEDGWHFLPCPDCRPDDVLVKLAWQFMGQVR